MRTTLDGLASANKASSAADAPSKASAASFSDLEQ